MLRAWFKKYQLQFKTEALTSRGAMRMKNGYFLFVNNGLHTGIGECSFIEGLSRDDIENYEKVLASLCQMLETEPDASTYDLENFPSIKFGLEMALRDAKNKGKKIFFDTRFSRGETKIP